MLHVVQTIITDGNVRADLRDVIRQVFTFNNLKVIKFLKAFLPVPDGADAGCGGGIVLYRFNEGIQCEPAAIHPDPDAVVPVFDPSIQLVFSGQTIDERPESHSLNEAPDVDVESGAVI